MTNDGDFLRFENILSNGIILDLDDSRDAMYNIAVCRHSCIAGLHQGCLKVYRMSTINNAGQKFDDEERISSRVVTLNNKLGDISSVCISGNFKYIIAGTVDGSIFRVYIKGFETDTITDMELMKNEISMSCVSILWNLFLTIYLGLRFSYWSCYRCLPIGTTRLWRDKQIHC